MKILEQINERIDLLQRIEKAKQTLDTLTINWATDISEIDFNKIPGKGGLLNRDKFIKVSKRAIEPNPDKEALFQSVLDSERIVDLIELMASGEKIIPPMYADIYDLKDGELILKESMWFIDGSHRTRIASFLQLPEIPIVVFERINRYLFTPNLWSFKAKELKDTHSDGSYTIMRYLEATSKNGKIIDFKNTQYPPYLSSTDSEDMGFIEICAN